ncbi:hypothetical protein N7520_003604 [Penicillium odoratum]|uniref:uncharacterized protein n=1 Tax=Penicillium odoratum TaxID=1167516 RepID=UPI0025492970|nr:uncharacterized protein N7520_003604 [Penicillium odoratum]KAJ5769045.1 hypothetical protein N7520_003604 [Penicillium odoratum]
MESLQAFTGYRSLPILAFYLTLCATLASTICLKIYRRYKFQKHQLKWHGTDPKFALFVLLAAFSLATTWYYMFAFFRHSYRSWETQQGPIQKSVIEVEPYLVKWELWLRDCKLFREAWESVSETPAKSWWSGQIFLWTIGWSLFLGVMGRRYHISHVWVYMLLGQIVAISFAQNLFFATILVSHQNVTPASKLSWTPPAILELAPIVISFAGAAAVPFVANTQYFIPVLAVPHLLLFIPGILCPQVLPRGWGTYISQSLREYTTVYKWLIMAGVALQAYSTYIVIIDEPGLLEDSVWDLGRKLLNTMFEHPAVSSVGWDVVCCSLSWFTWILLRGGLEEMLE